MPHVLYFVLRIVQPGDRIWVPFLQYAILANYFITLDHPKKISYLILHGW